MNTGSRHHLKIAEVVALISLVAAVAYNGWSIHVQGREEKEANRSAQIGLLTQLDGYVVDSDRAINATDAPNNRCKPHRIFTLPDDQQAAVFAALSRYEYLSWLFNKGHLTLDSTKAYWAHNMIDADRLGVTYFGRQTIAEQFPELSTFVGSTPRRLWPRDPCAFARTTRRQHAAHG